MEDVAYLAMAGAGAVFSLIVWWGYRRVESRVKRALFSLIAYIVGLFAYYALGTILAVVRPEHTHDIGAAIAHGVKTCTFIMILANSILLAIYRRPETQAPAKPQGGVREQLLKKRADIVQRIEDLRSSPVLNYRGGIPQPDVAIEELTETLKEINNALAEPSEQNG